MVFLTNWEGMLVSYYYNPYYSNWNDYNDPYRTMPVHPMYQPVGVGYEWVNKNVDILMNNGQCFSNVRFISVNMAPAVPGTPTEYLWTFEVYPPGGGGFNPLCLIYPHLCGPRYYY